MALSNWDTMTVNEELECVHGVFRSDMGVIVEAYKNWLYVRDESAWRDGVTFSKPTVMEIHSADMKYIDTKIYAVRDSDSGIYFAVWTGYKHGGNLKAMIGCAVYGWEGEEFVGVTNEHIEFLVNSMSKNSEVEHIIDWDKFLSGNIKRFNQGDKYLLEKILNTAGDSE